MVLMSAGKAARHQSSLVNRPTCGGNKKAGLMTYTNLRGAGIGKQFCGRFSNCLPKDKTCPSDSKDKTCSGTFKFKLQREKTKGDIDSDFLGLLLRNK